MLNIHELEQKWLKYKIKSYIPHVVIVISSILILVLIYILINSNYFKTSDLEIAKTPKIVESTVVVAKEQKEPVRIETIVEIPKIATPKPVLNTLKEPLSEQKLIISPSMNFIKNIQHDTIPYNNDPQYKSQPTPQKTEVQHQTAPTPEFVEEIVLSQPIKIEEKKVYEEEAKVSSISITRQNEYSDIEEVITRFKKNNNPTLSLFIAKKYYELGEYRNAYNYSLITNELNKDIEASWIIFAQTLVKLNEKDKAIKVLQDYVKHSNSNRASLLLDEIQSGKFK